MKHYLIPQWPAPPNIYAFSTLRMDGFSEGIYSSFNLGDHVLDNSNHVQQNRKLLQEELNLPKSCLWLHQVHEQSVIEASNWQAGISADGCYSNQTNQICTVMTADCLPILICNPQGTEVMALHGGWRSLSKNIIANGIQKFHTPTEQLLVWLGLCLSSSDYVVGIDVRNQFQDLNETELSYCFAPKSNQKYLLDLQTLASLQFKKLAVNNIYYDKSCTYSNPDLFFSHRRDKQTGRMATLIYFA